MVLNFLKNILPTPSTRQAAKGAKRPRLFRPRLEALEDRLVLATRIWDGSASEVLWTNRFHWQDDIAPVAGDDLVFPDASISFNDFATDTMFNKIKIENEVVIQGNRIKLGPGGLSAVDNSINDIGLNITIAAPLRLTLSSGPVLVRNGFTSLEFNGFTTTILNLSGAITGSRLTKSGFDLFLLNGDGRLILSNPETNLDEVVVQYGTLRIIGSMTIGTDTGSGTGTTVASGAVLELAGAVNVTGGLLGPQRRDIAELVVSKNTFNGHVVLGAASTIKSELGTLNIDGNINNGGFLLTVDGVGTTVFGGTGAISGTGGLTKIGIGKLTLAGSKTSTYSGPTNLNAGRLRLEKSSALGAAFGIAAGTTIAPGALLELGGGITVSAEPLTYAGNTLTLRSRDGTNTWGGNLFLNGLTVVSADTDPLRLAGVISGTSGAILNKFGASRLELSGNNTYTGSTSVAEGTVRVNGQQPSSRAVLSSGGTLEGVGTVGGISSIEGRVSPGSGGIGTLTSQGNVALDAASRFVAEVVPVTNVPADKLAVTGAVTLNNAQLQVVPPFMPSTTPGATFRIIDNDGTDAINGTFINLPENSTVVVPVLGVLAGQVFTQVQSYRINYAGGTGNDVVLTYLNAATMARDLKVTPGVLNEGQTATLSGRLVDPDPNSKLTLQVNWGDGSPVQTSFPGTNPFRLTHRYRNNPLGQPHGGQYRITITWFDQHGAGNSQERFVTVNNVTPFVDVGFLRGVPVGALLTHHVKFTDPGADTWTATVNYGDGSGDQPLEINPAKRFTIQHRYTRPGLYTVLVTLIDDDGGIKTDRLHVIVTSGR